MFLVALTSPSSPGFGPVVLLFILNNTKVTGLCQALEVGGDLLARVPQHLHEGLGPGGVPLSEESVGEALVARPAGAPDAVHVALDVVGEVVVNDAF